MSTLAALHAQLQAIRAALDNDDESAMAAAMADYERALLAFHAGADDGPALQALKDEHDALLALVRQRRDETGARLREFGQGRRTRDAYLARLS